MKLLRADALLALLALVLAATVVAGREMPGSERPGQPAQPAERLDLSLADRAALVVPPQAGDPFVPRDFNPPPPPPPVAPAAAASPQAGVAPKATVEPRLPFRYIGRMVDEDTTIVLLGRGEEILTVQPGQALGEHWRLDEIGEREAVFTYLPLETRQSLPL
jgi:hypothetical protein